MDLSLHCNVALCTLANGFSNTIARHKVPLFVVFYCSICFLLHIFAELRCVFQQRFQSNLWNFFPTINATAWIVVMVCLSDGQGVAEFRDLRYFTVHILPVVAASFHEIYIFSFCGFSSTATKGQLKTVWTIYSPALLLTSYALSYDQTEVYSYNLSPPNPLFVIFIGIFSNVRYVYFPFQLSWRKIWAVLFYLGEPKSNQMVSCKTLACSFPRDYW